MARIENNFDTKEAIRLPFGREDKAVRIDIYIGADFNAFEVATITETLSQAEAVAGNTLFERRFISDTPGLLTGQNGFLLRAEPVIDNHNLPDIMFVVGGGSGTGASWMSRLRQLKREARTVVLLSDAATAYIRQTQSPSGQVTTHWRDTVGLMETGYHPNLTQTLSERSDGIITAAGSGSTAEVVIGLIAPLLDAPEVAELGNRLLLPKIRNSDAEQPSQIADNHGLFDERITHAIKLMEDTLSEPLTMSELTRQLGVSTRHLERVFRSMFDQSPARFYKQLRTKRARVMIEETLVPLPEIAVASGFGTCNTMSQAVKREYGVTPSKMRERKNVTLLKFA